MLFLLPLLLLPFLTMAFWALGGGADTSNLKKRTKILKQPLPDVQLQNHKDRNNLIYHGLTEKDSGQGGNVHHDQNVLYVDSLHFIFYLNAQKDAALFTKANLVLNNPKTFSAEKNRSGEVLREPIPPFKVVSPGPFSISKSEHSCKIN